MRNQDIFYNTYNARHLQPAEVANSFIWSNNFQKLVQNNHSVILGARGCGKTTLMKMLMLPALYAWTDAKADEIRKNIPFYSIYISTDIYWDVKNQTYSDQLAGFGNFGEIISKFSVNCNVFKSICATFNDIINHELRDEPPQKEIDLCLGLIKAWKLSVTIPKLIYVIQAINERVDFVNQEVQSLIFNFKSMEDIPMHDFFTLNFESSIEVVIPLFERIYGLNGKKKWALCFDELEFAPQWLQTTLFTSLRSRTQYILYKLSASPILSSSIEKLLYNDYAPTSGNDLQVIKMWGADDNENFSKLLISSILKKKNHDVSLEQFFGTNNIYNKSGDGYDIDSVFYKQLIDLISKDDAFKSFLVKYNIDINNPIPQIVGQKDTVFRKIKPIVYFRNFYIESNRINENGEKNPILRSRKVSDLYFGIEVLSKICDGNPRWLIGLITSILARSGQSSADKKLQYSEIMSAANRFYNVICNIPIGAGNLFSLKDIIDDVCKFFNTQVLGPDFNMDPKGTFIVNESSEEIPDQIVMLLEKGISQGAFILLDSNDDTFDFKIRGMRFKLSYLLCFLNKLPLRKYPPIALSECLKKGSISVVKSVQPTLFKL